VKTDKGTRRHVDHMLLQHCQQYLINLKRDVRQSLPVNYVPWLHLERSRWVNR